MSKTGGGERKEDGKGEKEKKLPPLPPFPLSPMGGLRSGRVGFVYLSRRRARERGGVETAIAPRLKEGRFDVREDYYYFVRV